MDGLSSIMLETLSLVSAIKEALSWMLVGLAN